MNQELVRAVDARRLILFAGAGVSQNLSLPSHETLVGHLAEDLDYDPDIFKSHGDHLALAEYYTVKKGVGSLRSWMDREWHADQSIGDSEVHKLIVELDFPIIYTTNFDRWLERAYEYYKRPFAKIVNVADLAKAKDGIAQIVKFHGDFDDDDSLVLSETSYFDRLDFESALDIKLRADLLGRSVLFIGYSLSDINIRLMLHRLTRQWRGHEDQRPKSFVFMTRPNPVQEALLCRRGIEPIVSNLDDAGQGLTQFLRDLLCVTHGLSGK